MKDMSKILKVGDCIVIENKDTDEKIIISNDKLVQYIAKEGKVETNPRLVSFEEFRNLIILNVLLSKEEQKEFKEENKGGE